MAPMSSTSKSVEVASGRALATTFVRRHAPAGGLLLLLIGVGANVLGSGELPHAGLRRVIEQLSSSTSKGAPPVCRLSPGQLDD